MLKSIFCRSKKSTAVIPSHRGSPPTLDINQSDHEDDGFVLVGQTRSERTTVKAEDISIDAPPDYHTVINSSPPVSGGCEPPPPSLPYQPHHDVAFGTSMSLNVQHPSDSSQQLSELASIPCINTPTVQADSVRSQEAVTSQDSAAPADTRPANDAGIQGVPFRLCPALELTVTAHSAGINAGTFHAASPVSRYQYDFSVERSVLDNQHLSYW